MTRPASRRGDPQLAFIVETAIYLQTEARRLSREQAARLGVTATQTTVLKLLDEIGELSLSELSRKMAAQNSTVTGIVERMVQADLVVREQSAEDRRVWRIRLSERGRALARRIDVAPWRLLRQAVAALPPRERDTLVALLGKVAERVRAAVKEQDSR
jgi:DNA-binding MarR family transcriptional regulator